MTDTSAEPECNECGYDPDKYCACLDCRRMENVQAERDALKEALEEIARPIEAMLARAEASGDRLDGAMAVALSKDPHYLKDIARKALGEDG